MEKRYQRIKIDEGMKFYNENIKPHTGQKMTKRHLAKSLDVLDIPDKSKGEYMTHYNKGQRECPSTVLADIARVLCVTSDFLLGISDDPIGAGGELVIRVKSQT